MGEGVSFSWSRHPKLRLWLLCPPCSLRSSSSKLAQLTLEQILEHLDNLRLNLTNTKQNCMLSALSERMALPWLTPSVHPGGAALRHLTVPPSLFSLPLVFSQTPILQALQHVQASCDEAHKMK